VSLVPVLVCDLTDAEAHAVTVTENLHRTDLTPIQEAEGIERLQGLGWDYEKIAAQLGRTPSWIARRARLTALSPKAREEIENDREPWSVEDMEALAKLPVELQEQISGDRWGDSITRQIAHYTHLLHLAAWSPDDETLVPSAGACSACTCRSGCNPLLWTADDGEADNGLEPGDRCLNEKCWEAKVVANNRRQLEKHRAKNPAVVLVSSQGADDEEYGEKVHAAYRFEKCKKSDKGAVPILPVDGKGAGKLSYGIPLDGNLRKACKSAQAQNPDGQAVVASLADRLDKLERRRKAWVCKSYQDELKEAGYWSQFADHSAWSSEMTREEMEAAGYEEDEIEEELGNHKDDLEPPKCADIKLAKGAPDLLLLITAYGLPWRHEARGQEATLPEDAKDARKLLIAGLCDVWAKRLEVFGLDTVDDCYDEARTIAAYIGWDIAAALKEAEAAIPTPKTLQGVTAA
jgi:hypothetical protein